MLSVERGPQKLPDVSPVMTELGLKRMKSFANESEEGR